eukprot:GHVR01112737.1.p2 GENE.GHVR01112737.1~~GHVR01112737.1.p2  ORF type:complete len:148 (+),score=14.73 GHVR01112737.1:176-619(+)
MSNYSAIHNVGGYIKVVAGNVPVAAVQAGAMTGVAIDRDGYNSCVVHVATGAVTGSPDAISVTCKVYHSLDNSADPFAVYKPDGTNEAAITAVTAASSQGQLDVNLAGAKRYIKLYPVLAVTGGSGPPTVMVQTTVALGGATAPPVA